MNHKEVRNTIDRLRGVETVEPYDHNIIEDGIDLIERLADEVLKHEAERRTNFGET